MTSQQEHSQLEASLRLAESEITLWEHKLGTFQERQKKERALVREVAEAMFKPDARDREKADTLRAYLAAHKNHAEAEAQLMRLQIAKLQGQAALFKAAMTPATPSRLVAPGQ